MQNTALLLACSVFLVPMLGAQTQPPGKERPGMKRSKSRDARSFRRLEVPGDVVSQRVKRLTSEMRWHKTLRGALVAGRTGNKPVVFIQALGDIDGFL